MTCPAYRLPVPAYSGRGRPRTFCTPGCGLRSRYQAGPRLGRTPRDSQRNVAIVAAIRSGQTGAEVARKHGVSRERVRQIFTRATREGIPDIGWRCSACGGARNLGDRMAHRATPGHVAALAARRETRRRVSIVRFWSRVDRNGPVPEFAPHLGPCWMWTGAKVECQPGHFYGSAALRGERYAHRNAYILAVGPIPDGLQLDHLCRVTLCVNPTHLEAVTARENVHRGKNGVLRHLRAPRRPPTHCVRGHERTPENMTSGRNCRKCARVRYERRRAA
jgi:hypothetical protein